MAAKLLGHFFEHLFRQIALNLSPFEFNKLHDVSLARLTVISFENAAISIQFFHGAEVSAADSDNNNRDGQLGKLDQDVLGARHVEDGSIRQDKHDVVHWRVSLASHERKELLEKGRKISGSAEINQRQRRLVHGNDVVNTNNFRRSGVSIDGEAVACSLLKVVSAKSEHRERPVRVVRL